MRIVKLLLFLVSLLLVRVDVYAYDFQVNGLSYNKLSDSTVELTKDDVHYTGDIVVPSYVDYNGKRYDVVAIGDHAFYVCKGLTSITIPNSVTSIEASAFRDCSGLTSITIPNSVTSIGGWAFAYCSGLTSITIPNSVTSIGDYAFRDCSGLTSITIPNSVASIGIDAFFGCSGLTSITIPNSVTSIGNTAFAYCSGLTSITIPNSVTSIGNSAFAYCSGLTSITIPNSVTSIGLGAFGFSGLTSITIPNSVTSIREGAFGDTRLTSINVENGNPSYDSRNDCNAIIETSTNSLISGCMNTMIPNSVTSIETSAFLGCSDLTSITIPNSVTSIGSYAFSGCSGLTSITIPNSVTSIGSHAFYRCKGLTSIKSEITDPFTILEDVFSSSSYTEATLTVPYGTKAKYQSTDYWNKFTNIIEDNSEETGDVSFTMDNIQYEANVSTLKAEVQGVDNGFLNVDIPSSVTYGDMSYQVTSVASGGLSNRTFNYVSLPSTITSIDNSTFRGSTLGALFWNANASLSESVFSNMAMTVSSNFLLYVNSASYAPSNVKNVVVDGIAQTILLSDDGGNFYCPEGFTAQSISYTHNYSMATGGNGKGWEALALPFDVKNIEHKTKGTLTPFALYDSSNSSLRPFWLYELGSSGFRRSSGIKANTPYIIAMPNNTSYDSDYILTGDVTFSASNAKVYETSSVVTATSGSKRFVPAFSVVEVSSDVYTLNVSNQKVSYSGSYDKGSLFISNLRSAYPFEAYMTTSSSATRTRSIGIEFDDDATAIDIVPATGGETDIVKVYSINGILVLQTDHKSLQKQWESLPAGVYIVNGKKVLK